MFPFSRTHSLTRLALAALVLLLALSLLGAPGVYALPQLGQGRVPNSGMRNAPPVIEGGAPAVSVSMNEDGWPQAFERTLSAIDPNRDHLTWSIAKAPLHGFATASGLGGTVAVDYKPEANYAGTDSFVVRVTDEWGASDSIVVNVTLLPVNDAPVIADGREVVTVSMSEDGMPMPFDLTLSALDVERDPLYWVIDTPPAHGQAYIPSQGDGQVVTYRAPGDMSGADKFVVKVFDTLGDSDTIEVQVTIEPVNDAPTSGDVFVSTFVNTDLALPAGLFTFSDVDGGSFAGLRFTLLPEPGTLYLDGNGNGTIDEGEALVTDQSVGYAQLSALKFKPASDGSGATSALGLFRVNDGALDADFDSLLVIDVLQSPLQHQKPALIETQIQAPAAPNGAR